MKISIITVSYNSAGTIERTLQSVKLQTYPDIEHIVIDGLSTDTTLEIVRNFDHVSPLISEKDLGIYDAMNKGIKAATGDIIGFLNSDDFFTDSSVVSQIAQAFKSQNIDAFYADVQYVSSKDLNKIIRYYSSSSWNVDRLKYGFLPAHPTFYVKKSLYEELGGYRIDYKIAADFDLILRFFTQKKLKVLYLPHPIVTMLKGGVSTRNIRSKYIAGSETIQSCRENSIKSNWFFMMYRFLIKSFEIISQ